MKLSSPPRGPEEARKRLPKGLQEPSNNALCNLYYQQVKTNEIWPWFPLDSTPFFVKIKSPLEPLRATLFWFFYSMNAVVVVPPRGLQVCFDLSWSLLRFVLKFALICPEVCFELSWSFLWFVMKFALICPEVCFRNLSWSLLSFVLKFAIEYSTMLSATLASSTII